MLGLFPIASGSLSSLSGDYILTSVIELAMRRVAVPRMMRREAQVRVMRRQLTQSRFMRRPKST